MLQRRHILRRLPWLALAAAAPSWAQTVVQSDDDQPLVDSAQIVDALSKDITLDRGTALRRPQAPGTSSRPAATAAAGDASVRLQVAFAFASATLLPQGQRQLDLLAAALGHQSLAAAGFELSGHTDAVGDAGINLRLSYDRARAVRDYLVQSHGIDPRRLQAIGFGASRLADPLRPTSPLNRRVEVRRVALDNARLARELPDGEPAPAGRMVPTPR